MSPLDEELLAGEAAEKWEWQFRAALRLVTMDRVLRLVKLVNAASSAETCPHCGGSGSWGNHQPECEGRQAAYVLESLDEAVQEIAAALKVVLKLSAASPELQALLDRWAEGAPEGGEA